MMVDSVVVECAYSITISWISAGSCMCDIMSACYIPSYTETHRPISGLGMNLGTALISASVSDISMLLVVVTMLFVDPHIKSACVWTQQIKVFTGGK